MQCTFISLEDITYDVNLFYPQALVSTKSSKFCTYFVFPGLFWDDMVAARSTSLGCLYRLELHLDRLFLVYQQGFFCQQVFLGRFQRLPRQSCSISVSSEFKFLDAQNLTCLQPLSNALYTNCCSLKHRDFIVPLMLIETGFWLSLYNYKESL